MGLEKSSLKLHVRVLPGEMRMVQRAGHNGLAHRALALADLVRVVTKVLDDGIGITNTSPPFAAPIFGAGVSDQKFRLVVNKHFVVLGVDVHLQDANLEEELFAAKFALVVSILKRAEADRGGAVHVVGVVAENMGLVPRAEHGLVAEATEAGAGLSQAIAEDTRLLDIVPLVVGKAEAVAGAQVRGDLWQASLQLDIADLASKRITIRQSNPLSEIDLQAPHHSAPVSYKYSILKYLAGRTLLITKWWSF